MSSRSLPGRPLLNVPIREEPRGLLGRFFIRVDQLIRDQGLEVRVVDPVELIRINQLSQDSWFPLTPNCDYRVFPAAAGCFDVLACYDGDGQPVATISARRYDMTGTTLRAEVESLRFFYGPEADTKTSPYSFTLSAPSALNITGAVSYGCAMWTHPKFRKGGFTKFLPKLGRYFAYSQSSYDYWFGLSVVDMDAPSVGGGYTAEGVEYEFAIKNKGTLQYSGTIAWASRRFLLQALADDIEAFESAASIREIRRRE